MLPKINAKKKTNWHAQMRGTEKQRKNRRREKTPVCCCLLDEPQEVAFVDLFGFELV